MDSTRFWSCIARANEINPEDEFRCGVCINRYGCIPFEDGIAPLFPCDYFAFEEGLVDL